MAIHMRNGIPYGGIPNGIVSGETPSTVPTTVKQLNQVGAVGKIAPVTIPSAVKFSNGDTLETAIGSVATIETSPAVAAHDAGEYIFYNGQMYKVIAAIAVGETLTVGTNISSTTVGTELTALNAGLIDGMGAKLLWSGNFTGSGSLTVDGLSDWLIVGYTMYESLTNIEYLMIGTPSRGGLPYGVYDATSTTVAAYRFLVSGDTITVNSANRGLYFSSSTTYNNGAEAHIRHIFGIIKKPTSN